MSLFVDGFNFMIHTGFCNQMCSFIHKNNLFE